MAGEFKIGIDIRALLEGKITGVEEYTLNLLKNLFELDKKERKNSFFLFYNSFKKVKLPEFLKGINIKKFHYPNKIFNLSLKIFGFPRLDKMSGGAKAFFLPSFRLCPVSHGAKLVVTFHDLSFLRYPEFFSLSRRFWHFLMAPREIAKRADKIIAISSSTKNDLVTLYGINPEKIKVTYLGIDKKYKVIPEGDSRFLKIKKKYNLPEDFILFLGTIEPRKNITGLVRAFKILKEKHKIKEKLVIAGMRGWLFKEVFYEIKKLRLENNIIFTGFVEDSDKPYLYNLAKVFVYPSFYEGFGFPPLEAMACGVPVIASNVSSLPEVVGNAAIMINPFNPEEISEGMINILFDSELRESLVKKGLERAKNFSWEKCARETREILSSC